MKLTRQHQQLWSIDRTRRNDHFRRSENFMSLSETIKLNTNRLTLVIEQNLRDMSKGDNMQILPISVVIKISSSSGTSRGSSKSTLSDLEAILIASIDVKCWIAKNSSSS